MKLIGKVSDRVLTMLVPGGRAAAADCNYEYSCMSVSCSTSGRTNYRRQVCWLGDRIVRGNWSKVSCC